LGAVPRDEAVEEIVFRGEPVYALENSPAVEVIGEVMERIGVR